MSIRTDLALEQQEIREEQKGAMDGVETEKLNIGETNITRIKVTDGKGQESINRAPGTYVTIEAQPLTNDSNLSDDILDAIKTEMNRLLPPEGLILVVGLGNTEITPDALGPKAASKVLATRHITGEFARTAGLDDLRPVAVLAPGVMGQTGMETFEIISGIVEKICPAAVIVIDALASRKLSRLGCTIQISDTGIAPGAGVGNRRLEINKDTLGVPVVAIGVPTVVDAATLVEDLTGESIHELQDLQPRGAGMIVTPREIDLLIDRASRLVSHGLNIALQPTVHPEDLLSLVS